MKKKKIFFLMLMLIGLISISYPFLSHIYKDYLNSRDILSFDEFKSEYDEKDIKNILNEARDYKNRLSKNGASIVDPFDLEKYESNYSKHYNLKSEEFGYLAIPKLDLYNKIYIGANQKNLFMGLGQVEGTDMPIGGMGTRCVIAGHRGTHRDLFFRYLDKLEVGDKIYVLSPVEKLVYRVESMEVILPTENEKLLPYEDKDMLSLITCTPYPINNKRLLVNAIRDEEKISVDEITKEMNDSNLKDDKIKMIKLTNKIVLGICIILIIKIILLLKREIKK